jgi:hypothetical protein
MGVNNYEYVEASETRGTTALVYCLINSSLYTETVQGWWSTPPTGLTVGRGEVHPNWLTVSRGVGSSPQVRIFGTEEIIFYVNGSK